MQIDITYDASVATNPNEAAFKACCQAVANFFDSQFTNAVTIHWDIGWGEVDGQMIAGGSGAASVSNYTSNNFTYAQIRTALTNNATSAAAKTAVASLSATDPTAGGQFNMTYAEAKALGLMSANATGIDGWSGLDTTSQWVYNTSNTPGGNVTGKESDAFSFLAHELSEVLGRQMDFATNDDGNGYYPEDLFDYKSNGVRTFTSSVADRYFSIDGGKTNTAQHYFNNVAAAGDLFDYVPNGQPGSYNPNGPADSFDFQGSVGIVSAADLTLMNVLGYQTLANFTWKSQVSANFNTAADWAGGVVPGSNDRAIMKAAGATAYTVTASTNETVYSIETAQTATLAITGGLFRSLHGTDGGANAGAVTVAAGATFIINGYFDNTGTLTTSGTLVDDSPMIGGGTVNIGGGTADFVYSFTENVDFTANAGRLILAHSAGYTGTITGFSKTGGTSLDLQDIAYATATQSYSATTGVLTVGDGTHTAHITLAGSYAGSTFTLSKDAHGGTIVVDPTASPASQATSPDQSHQFVAAMAAFAAPAAGSLASAGGASWSSEHMLAMPRGIAA